MRTRTGLIATTSATLALVAACGHPASQPGGTVSTAPAGCTSGPVRVTDADNGKTLCVTTGSSVDVVLHAPDRTTRWSPVEPDSDVVAPAASPSGPAGTTSAAFTAERAGTVHLSSSRPACGGSGPVHCGAVQGFQVTVTVS